MYFIVINYLFSPLGYGLSNGKDYNFLFTVLPQSWALWSESEPTEIHKLRAFPQGHVTIICWNWG